MQKIPKCKTKYIIPQPNGLKVAKKEYLADESVTIINNNAEKISKKKLKFSGNRRFGNDITNAIKIKVKKNLIENSVQNSNLEKTNTNIYIKKHSSAAQKNGKTNEENKSEIPINKKNHSTSVFNSKNNVKHHHTISEITKSKMNDTKLHNAISFGFNPKEVLSDNKKNDNTDNTIIITENKDLM